MLIRRRGVVPLLFRVGHRVGLHAGWGSSAHRLGLVIAAAAVMMTAWLYVSVDAVYAGRYERLAARTPVLAGADRADEAFARWEDRGDTLGERRFSVVYLSPLRSDAPPPPGLSRWPRVGEAFVSPALLATDPAMASRYGRVAGTIGADGLSERDEWLVYLAPVAPAAFDRDPGGGSPFVVSWGVDASVYSAGPEGAPYFLDGHSQDRPAGDLYWLLTIVVGLPVAGLVVVCVRLGAERRDRRMAMLRALGAPRRAQAAVLAGEALVPVSIGTSIAAVAAALTTVTGAALPFAGYAVSAADLARARLLIPPLWLLTVGVLLVAAVPGQLRARKLRGNRPSVVKERAHAWAPFTFALFMAIALGGAIRHGDGGIAAYLIGLAGALATLPLVAGRIAAALGRMVARFGDRTGQPAPIVGGRWLAGRPNALARLSAALVIGLCLATIAQISFTQLDTALARDRRISERIGDAVIEVRARWDLRELRRFSTVVGTNRLLYVLDTGDNGVELTGTCASLANLGELASCPAATVALDRGYTRLTPAGDVVRHDSLLSADLMSVRSAGIPASTERVAGVLVFNKLGRAGVEQVKRVAFATVSMPGVSVPGEFALTGTAAWAALANWLLEFLGWGLLVLFGAGVLAAIGVFLAMSRELGPLAAQGAGRGLFLGVAMWNVTAPLGVAVLVSAAVAAGLGRMLIELSRVGTLDVTFLALVSLTGLGVAAAVGVVCGEGAAHRARSWHPEGD